MKKPGIPGKKSCGDSDKANLVSHQSLKNINKNQQKNRQASSYSLKAFARETLHKYQKNYHQKTKIDEETQTNQFRAMQNAKIFPDYHRIRRIADALHQGGFPVCEFTDNREANECRKIRGTSPTKREIRPVSLVSRLSRFQNMEILD